MLASELCANKMTIEVQKTIMIYIISVHKMQVALHENVADTHFSLHFYIFI